MRTSSDELLTTIPPELRETTNLQIVSTPGEHAKALGLHWDMSQDCFYVATPDVSQAQLATKRVIASIIARTFDALGWFSPALMAAKVLLQQAWILKLGWDDQLPAPLQQTWKVWLNDLPNITSHPIPRYLGTKGRSVLTIQLHGFSDASTIAYGGVVYSRTFYANKEVSVTLVAAKARLATPKPKTLTVPRLELRGAVILAQLIKAVAGDLSIPCGSIFTWCDSAAVLGWINHEPSRLKTYVSNRITKIKTLVPPCEWRYVSTDTNPADLITRGVNSSRLSQTELWWQGPPWLSLDPFSWPHRADINLDRELPELKPLVMKLSAAPEEIGTDISSFRRLIRVIGWVLRFCSRAKGEQATLTSLSLTLSELKQAEIRLWRHSQRQHYEDAYDLLKNKHPLPRNHPLSSLSPYIDDEELLRVGGHLQKSELSSASTHPLILHARSHSVKIMVRHVHETLMHAGPSTVMATLASTYYISKLHPLIKKISQSCVPCQKAYARTSQQYMGQLPADRVQPSRPFTVTGIDYAGPVFIKGGTPRRPTRIKTYICVFICFSTKAIHLETVSDMTTAAFLAALTRFTARRGRPAKIHTDNGSNFVGAEAELRRMLEHLRSAASEKDVSFWAANNQVEWKFLPAQAPHFGGLWESQ